MGRNVKVRRTKKGMSGMLRGFKREESRMSDDLRDSLVKNI